MADRETPQQICDGFFTRNLHNKVGPACKSMRYGQYDTRDKRSSLYAPTVIFAPILPFSVKCLYASGFFGVKVIVCRAFLVAAPLLRARSRSPTGPTEGRVTRINAARLLGERDRGQETQKCVCCDVVVAWATNFGWICVKCIQTLNVFVKRWTNTNTNDNQTMVQSTHLQETLPAY